MASPLQFLVLCFYFSAHGTLTLQESNSQNDATSLAALREKTFGCYRDGDYQRAFEFANRLATQQPNSIANQMMLGEVSFAVGNMDECIAAYDAAIKLDSKFKPQLWQRGLALYYAGHFSKGVEQFRRHQTVNPQDVENSVWHLLCAAKISRLNEARASMIPIKADVRVPMSEIYELFAGRLKTRDVIAAAEKTSNAVRKGTRQHKLQLYYAYLYIGLFHEMNGNELESLESLKLAEKNNPLSKTNFMGQVARVHLQLRTSKEK